MTDSNSQYCNYSHETEDLEWNCPHLTSDGESKCPFHRAPDRTSATEIRAAFIQAVQETPRRWEFIGATIPELDLRNVQIDIPNQEAIDLRGAEISGDVLLDYLTVRQSIILNGTVVKGDIRGFNTDIDGEFSCDGMVVQGDCMLTDCRFGKHASLTDITIEGKLDLSLSVFKKNANFYRATINGKTSVLNTVFQRTARFVKTNFGYYADLSASEYPKLILKPAKTEDTNLIELTNAKITSGKIVISDSNNGESPLYDCSKTILKDVSIKNNNGDVLQNLRFRKTEFDGFNFFDYREELQKNNYNIHEISESEVMADGGGLEKASNSELEQLYKNAASGAQSVGATEIASEFKIRSRLQQRKEYLERLKKDSSIFNQVNWGFRYLSNFLEHVVSGYGEKANFVVFTNATITIVFALQYYVLQNCVLQNSEVESSSTMSNAILLSFEAMAAFLFGMPSTSNLTILTQTLVVIQALIGFVLIGVVFVSIITKRVN